MKKLVQEEILAKLDSIIDKEISAMGNFYTVAEIAGEVLLQVHGLLNQKFGGEGCVARIFIDGYWLDAVEEKFTDYQCVIGVWDGNEDNPDIFYYFESEKELESFKEENKEGRTDSEFVITEIRRN